MAEEDGLWWEINWKGRPSQVLDCFLELSRMSSAGFACYSAGNGEQAEVCGLELDLISVLFNKDSSDGILKDQYLRDIEEES